MDIGVLINMHIMVSIRFVREDHIQNSYLEPIIVTTVNPMKPSYVWQENPKYYGIWNYVNDCPLPCPY